MPRGAGLARLRIDPACFFVVEVDAARVDAAVVNILYGALDRNAKLSFAYFDNSLDQSVFDRPVDGNFWDANKYRQIADADVLLTEEVHAIIIILLGVGEHAYRGPPERYRWSLAGTHVVAYVVYSG